MKDIMINVVRDQADGQILLPTRDMSDDGYDYLSLEEFIEAVEACDTWDYIDAEVYDHVLDRAGLDFQSYDDPDEMWEDFLEAVEVR